MNPKVVHCNKSKFDVYIGRPSKWGNPFVIGKDGTRKQVIQLYREWIVLQSHLLSDLHELQGKTLGCYCFPQECHGNVLYDLANSQPELFKSVNKQYQVITRANKMNPYRHLFSKLKALMLAEHKLSDEEKKNNQWLLTYKFHGTQVLIGKGDVSTIFYQLGSGKRKVCYPDDMAELLEKLGKRRYWVYKVVNSFGKEQLFFSEKSALAVEPETTMVIQGLGESVQTVFTAKRSVRGYTWEPVKQKVKK